MSDNIDIPIQASGEDGVNRLVSSLDRLHASMEKLGSVSALGALTEQMKVMQATMVTGFANLAALAGQSEVERERIAKDGADKRLRAQLAWEAKQHAAANKFHDKQIEIEAAAENRRASALQALIEKRDIQTHAWQQREAQSYVRFWERIVAEQDRAAATQVAIERRRDTEMHALRAKEHNDYVAWWEKSLAKQIEIEQRRDVEMHALRAKEHSSYVNWWQSQLATQEAAQARQLEMERAQQVALATIRATAAEKQRTLNTSFITSPLATQIATAEKAKTYAHLGGNAAEKYGTVAAAADLAALRKQYDLLPAAIRNAQNHMRGHNDAMREAHSLMRGLTGSLGGLWLTYGSLVPLAAGAAIAASLKNIVVAGKEVEYQLAFVAALGNGTVRMDDFLRVTDSTIVSVKEAAEGMRALAQNGMQAETALRALPTVLNLAVIGEMSVAQAALAATGALSAFGLAKDDIGRVGDIFAKAAATSNTSVLAMTESMRQASTVASVYGSTIEETAAALGTLAKINVTGSAAGTAYTNMLTNLYSPTRQAAAALKELGVTTDDGMGGMKNSTQLLTELRTALSRFNEPARADILGDIFTVRGQKAAATIISNLDDYKKKIEEAKYATGFMGQAVARLEDTTTGAFNRLKNSVSSSLNRAFADSSPILQEMITHLGQIARSEGTVATLTYMADAALRLTKGLIDNAGAIGTVVAGLVGMRIIGGVTAMIGSYTAASAAATTASTALAARMTLLNASLGYIGLAVTALVLGYQLLVAETTNVEKADARMRNSIETNIEYIERETRAWEERNRARNPAETAKASVQFVAEKEASVNNAQAEYDRLRKENGPQGFAVDAAYKRLREEQAALKKARDLLWKETTLGENLEVGLSQERLANEKKAVSDSIAALVAKGQTHKTLNGQIVAVEAQGNAASRAIALSADKVNQMLAAGTIDVTQAKIELLAIEQKYNAALDSRAAKPDTKGENAQLAASLKRLDVELQLQQLQSQSDLATAKQQNRRGEIGDLELINRELAAKLALDQAAVDVARQQYVLAEGKDKVAKMATYEGRAQVAVKQAVVDTKEADEKRMTVLARMAEEEKKFEAKALSDRGQYVDAFLMEYEASYGASIARVSADLETTTDETTAAALGSYMLFLARMQQAGKDNALAKQVQDQFGAALDGMDARLQNLADASGPGAGLMTMFRNATAAAKEYETALPALMAKQKEMQALAERTQDPKDQKAAASMLARIKSEANQARNIWVDVSKSIGESLSQAFDKGSKALGDLITVTAQYGARQQQIRDDYEKSDKGIDAKKQAAQDHASAQINAYANMASAAAGFFDTQSKGYQGLMTLSKVFHAAELAMTMAELVPKAISAVLNQGSGDPYTAFGRMAAMAALVASLGVAISGTNAKPDTTAKDRQAAQGTGSVFGDIPDRHGKYSVKSDSIARSLDIVASNSAIELNYTAGMLTALRNIENNIGAFASLMVRSSGITGNYATDNKSFDSKMITGAGAVAGGVGGAMLGTYLGIGFAAIGGPLGMALGAVLGGLLGGTFIGKALSKVFGGSTSVTDTGFTMANASLAAVLAQGAKASQYTDVKTDGGWFRSDKTNTQMTSLGTDANNQFTTVIKSLAEGVTEAGKLLGVGGDDFVRRLNSFAVDIGRVSLKGKTGEEIEKELNAVFSKLGDDMARWSVAGLEPFQKVGEGYLETLVRVASNYANLDSVLKSIGMVFGATGIASIAAREHLIGLSGGINEMANQAKGFADSFLTEAERLAPVQAYVTEQLRNMGLASIDTRDEFKQHVLGLDLTVVAEREQYAALMMLQEAFAKVYAATEDLTKSQQEIADERRSLQEELDDLTKTSVELLAMQRSALDASNRALFDQVQAAKAVVTARDDLNSAYEEEKQNLQENVDRIKSLGESWKKFRDNLLMGDKSPLTPQQKYAEAREQFDKTLTAARGGDTDAQSRYEEVANQFLEASRTANASGANYTADFTRVLTATDEAVVWASQQVDVGRASLTRLDESVSHLIDIKTGVMTVAEALTKLAAAEGALTGAGHATSIDTVYRSLLGREADAAGMAFWKDAMKRGATADDVSSSFKNSPEYRGRTGGVSGQAQADANTAADGMTRDQAERMLTELARQRADAERQAQMLAEQQHAAAAAGAGQVAEAVVDAAREAAWNETNMKAYAV